VTARTHGTYTRYKLEGCRCYPCAGAASDYRANRERAIAYGTWQPFVDHGCTPEAAAQRLGITVGYVKALHRLAIRREAAA